MQNALERLFIHCRNFSFGLSRFRSIENISACEALKFRYVVRIFEAEEIFSFAVVKLKHHTGNPETLAKFMQLPSDFHFDGIAIFIFVADDAVNLSESFSIGSVSNVANSKCRSWPAHWFEFETSLGSGSECRHREKIFGLDSIS